MTKKDKNGRVTKDTNTVKEKMFHKHAGKAEMHEQIHVNTHRMEGSKPSLEGQCFIPASTFAAGTNVVTSNQFKSIMTSVTAHELQVEMHPRGCWSEIWESGSRFLNPKHFFETVTSGMWMLECSIGGKGARLYLGYDGWRGILHEPFKNELVLLELPDNAGTPLTFCIIIVESDFMVFFCVCWGFVDFEDELPPFPVAFMYISVYFIRISELFFSIHSPWLL